MQGQHPQRGGTGNNAVLEIEKDGFFGMNGGGGKNWFAVIGFGADAATAR
jgi:hypothetical protein